MEMLTCVNCRWCQPKYIKTHQPESTLVDLKCKEGQWVDDHGLKKCICLDNTETKSLLDGNVKIKKRKIFELANNCKTFVSMD